MKYNSGLSRGHETSEGFKSSDSEVSDSDLSEDSSLSDSVEDSSLSEAEAVEESAAACSSGAGIPTFDDVNIVLDENEEDDEVVKAIIRSRNQNRNHPPTITLEDTASDICFHPVNDLIACASITGDVLLYNYDNETTELRSTLELHEKACRDIEFNEDGTLLFSSSKDKSIILSDVETERMTRIYENAHEQPIYSMTVLDNNTFVTGDDEGTVRMWDLRQNNNIPIFSLKEMEDFVSCMVTNDEKKYLVCSGGDGTLTTINMRGHKLHVQTEDYPQELTCIGLFKNGRKILVSGSKGNLYLFNWGEFGLHSDEIPSFTKKSINCMIPITENIVVTGGEDKVLRAINLFPNRPLGVVGQHDLSIESLDICNNGSVIASYSYDNTVKFWNVSYFENIIVPEKIKGGKQKQLKHNLPSSKAGNASDFFSDL